MVTFPSLDPTKQEEASGWLQGLVESSLDGIITMDGDGRIVAFNPAAEKMFGYRCDQVVGRRVSETLIPKSYQKFHERGVAGYLATGRKEMIGRRVEVTAMRADRSVFPAELAVVSVNSGKAPVFIACLRDISETQPVDNGNHQHTINIKKTLMQTILAVSRIVEMRDPYTAGHQRRVAHLAAKMAKKLGFSEEHVDGVFLGALIHDIGKIAIPSEILSRPGKLLEEDINYLKIHCRKGYEILKPVSFPWPVAEIALQHHEHIDGSGYPKGLQKEEILMESRIVCVADVVESLTAHRPYRPAYTLENALKFVRNGAGICYDRQVVAVCDELFNNGYSIDAIDMEELTWMAALS